MLTRRSLLKTLTFLAIAGIAAIGTFILVWPVPSEGLVSRPNPARDYAESEQRIRRLQAAERQALNPDCYTQFLTQGQAGARDRAHPRIQLPRRSTLGEQFHSGYNVLIVPQPHHGLADRMTGEQGQISAEAGRLCGHRHPSAGPVEPTPRVPGVFGPTVRGGRAGQSCRGRGLVVLTLYSPFMWARHLGGEANLANHLKENPEAVKKGLEIMTENVLALVRGCKRVGIDGFYASSQGGEAFRFQGTEFFRETIKPTDLAVWDEIGSCTFNVLHVCDYEGGYDDFTPFLDYPGHIVNASLKLGDRTMSTKEISRMFGRPFMGGMERKGVIATGSPEEVRRTVEGILTEAPERFILAADCTVPGDTSWDNLKVAIDTAHRHRG
jgi:hypothetical protein